MSARGILLDLRERRALNYMTNSVLVPAKQMDLSNSKDRRFATPESRFRANAPHAESSSASKKLGYTHAHSTSKERMNSTLQSVKSASSPRNLYRHVKAKVDSNCRASKSPSVRLRMAAETLQAPLRKRSDLDGPDAFDEPEQPKQLSASRHPKPNHPSLKEKSCNSRRTREMRTAVARAEERLAMISRMETCRAKILLLQKDLTHRLINEVISTHKPKKITVKAVTALYQLLRAVRDQADDAPELSWEELQDYFTYKKRLLYEITDVKRRIETESADLSELGSMKIRFFKEEEEQDHSRALLDKNVRLILAFVGSCVNYALLRHKLGKSDAASRNETPVRGTTIQQIRVTKTMSSSSSASVLNPERSRPVSPGTKNMVKSRIESKPTHSLMQSASRGSLRMKTTPSHVVRQVVRPRNSMANSNSSIERSH